MTGFPNGDFETGDWAFWADAGSYNHKITTDQSHDGSYSFHAWFTGTNWDQTGPRQTGFTLPAGTTIGFWYRYTAMAGGSNNYYIGVRLNDSGAYWVLTPTGSLHNPSWPNWDYFSGTTTVDATSMNLFVYGYHNNGDECWIDGLTFTTPTTTPVANFIATPLNGQAPLIVQFNDLTTGAPTSWNWNFGDGGTSTSQNPSHIYTAIGTYTVSLTSTNTDGNNTNTKTGYITVTTSPVTGAPVVSFSGTPLSGNKPLPVTFTGAGTNTPTRWRWAFGDNGSSTVQSPSHTYTVWGNYDVTFNATNDYGTGSITIKKYISVRATPPTPPSVPTSPVSPTGPGDVYGRLSNPADGAITYQLNSSTSAEDVGSQYDAIMALQGTTNYDLRTRAATYIYPYTSFDASSMIVTNSGGSWATNEFAGMWIFFVGQSPKGVQTYGVIASNTATTITCNGMVGDVPATTGIFLLYRGYSIDFLPDISQPSVVRNLNVNKDTYQYSDNDDTRKLSNKVVVSGKDLFGKSITVMVEAVHNYDNDKQFFSDSTIVTRRSEGYVYKNNYCAAADQRSVTATKAATDTFTTGYSSFPYDILIAGGDLPYYPVNCQVTFSTVVGTLPSNIVAGTIYYVVVNSGHIEISTTPGGASMDIGSDEVGTCYISTIGGLIISNTDGFVTNGMQIVLIGVTAPGVIALGSTITNQSPTYSSATYWINCGTSLGPGVGGGLTVYHKSALGGGDAGTIPVAYLYGWQYTIPSGSSMAFCIPNSGVVGIAATTVSTTLENTDSSGVQYTAVYLSAFPAIDFSGRGYLMNSKLWVQTQSNVGTHEVLIGEEKITISAVGNDATYGNYIQFADPTLRVTSATLKCYPHDVGALVARTNYTEASPQSHSSIAVDGIHIGNFTVDGNISYGQLDQYATYQLLGLGTFYRKASTWAPIPYGYVNEVGIYHGGPQVFVPRPIAVGDRISVTRYSADTPIEYEVVQSTVHLDTGQVVLQLGDFEKNPFTSLTQKTNALDRTLT